MSYFPLTFQYYWYLNWQIAERPCESKFAWIETVEKWLLIAYCIYLFTSILRKELHAININIFQNKK